MAAIIEHRLVIFSRVAVVDRDAVEMLQPDHAAIAAATRRALIVTAWSPEKSGPACVFRYFAPQYGNPEDPATGSAAVQLAAFWALRRGVTRLSAAQLSDEGAYVRLGCNAGTVDLAARVGYR